MCILLYGEIYIVLKANNWNYKMCGVCKEWRDIFDDQCPVALYDIDEDRIKPRRRMKFGCPRKPIYTKLYWMSVNNTHSKQTPDYERVFTNEETLQYRYNTDLVNQLGKTEWCQVCGKRAPYYAVIPRDGVRSTRFMFVCNSEACPHVAVEMVN